MPGACVSCDIQRGSKPVTQCVQRSSLGLLSSVDGVLPDLNQLRYVAPGRISKAGRRQAKAIALGTRIPNRYVVDVDEAREQPAIEQRKRRPVFAGVPKLPGRRPDVIRKA